MASPSLLEALLALIRATVVQLRETQGGEVTYCLRRRLRNKRKKPGVRYLSAGLAWAEGLES